MTGRTHAEDTVLTDAALQCRSKSAACLAAVRLFEKSSMNPVPALPCSALRESRRSCDTTTVVAASTTHNALIGGGRRIVEAAR
jgi:hypothetical protein